MSKDPSVLKNYLVSSADIQALGTSTEKAAWMNVPRVTKSKEVDASLAYKYLVKKMRWRGIESAANNPASAATDAAYSAVKLVTGPDVRIDFTDPVAIGLLGILESDSLIDATNKEDIIALSEYQISVAESIGWGGLHDYELAAWIDKVEAV